jgi:hypothetical protein
MRLHAESRSVRRETSAPPHFYPPRSGTRAQQDAVDAIEHTHCHPTHTHTLTCSHFHTPLTLPHYPPHTQKMFLAFAPLIRMTFIPTELANIVAIWKMKTASSSPVHKERGPGRAEGSVRVCVCVRV